ncbi:MAG TPA: hypothetical protein ENI85_03360 [Deltaproteobacteria bacterium]|nr:hypothetical protein [Deltaproteobacteria bacterium]
MPEGLPALDPSDPHRRRIGTSNLLRRQNRERALRTTAVTPPFPNEASLPERVKSMVAEISDAWKRGPTLRRPALRGSAEPRGSGSLASERSP